VRLTTEIGSYQFDGNDSIDQDVTRSVDNAHSPFADARFEPVPTGDDFTQGRIVRGPTA
jgi:hypothetical protein